MRNPFRFTAIAFKTLGDDKGENVKTKIVCVRENLCLERTVNAML